MFYPGLYEDVFEETVRMSTYLVAFVVCDYSNLTDHTKAGVRVSVFAPTHLIDQGQFALDTAVHVLEFLGDFFGIPYPMPKQGTGTFLVNISLGFSLLKDGLSLRLPS